MVSNMGAVGIIATILYVLFVIAIIVVVVLAIVALVLSIRLLRLRLAEATGPRPLDGIDDRSLRRDPEDPSGDVPA